MLHMRRAVACPTEPFDLFSTEPLSVKLVTDSVPSAPTMTPKIAGSWFRKFPIYKE